jgi:ComF family protein
MFVWFVHARAFWHTVTTFIMPPFCAYCSTWLMREDVLCETCTDKLQPVVSCQVRLTPSTELTVFAASSYHDPLKALILAKRWSHYHAATQLGRLVVEHTPIDSLMFDYIVPVPLHWTRRMTRGFNQAAVIAEVISKKTGKPIVELVRRKQRTQFQLHLKAPLRQANVQDAFELVAVDAHLYAGATFLIVDDLMTTGATLKYVGKTLLNVKPRALYAVVASRVI